MTGMGLKEVVLSVALSACVASTPRGAPEQSGTARDEARESVEPNRICPKMGGLASCPSAVPGATTRVTTGPEGVDVVITSPIEGQAAEIRGLARRLAGLRPTSEVARPPGEGTGGGEHGACPVVIVGSDLTVEDVEGGARILVKDRRAAVVGAFQAIPRERADAPPTARE